MVAPPIYNRIIPPTFGRPNWTYVTVRRQPVLGPQPHLAQGKVEYLEPSSQGYGIVASDYRPASNEYQPSDNQNRRFPIPRRGVHAGDNGRQIVGTYEPHPFEPAQRFMTQDRRAANWQVMGYPPGFRNTLTYLQVEKYVIQTFSRAARPLPKNNYFLGYQIDPQVAAGYSGANFGMLGGSY